MTSFRRLCLLLTSICVLASAAPAHAAWDEPQPLAFAQNKLARMAVGGDGQVSLAWVGCPDGGTGFCSEQVITTSDRQADGSFSAPVVRTAPFRTFDGYEWEFAGDPQGGMHLAWSYNGENEYYTIRAADRDGANGSWTTPVNPRGGDYLVRFANVAVERDGASTVGYFGLENVEGSEFYSLSGPTVARRSPGGSYSAPQRTQVYDSRNEGEYPIGFDMVGNFAGDLLVAHQRSYPSGSGQVLAQIRRGGGAWSAPEPVGSEDVMPTFALDEDGDAAAVWVAGPSLMAATRSDAGWSAPVTLATGDETFAGRPQISDVLYAKDTVSVAYTVGSRLYLREKRGALWGPAEQLGNYGFAGALDADEAGNTVLAYTDTDATGPEQETGPEDLRTYARTRIRGGAWQADQLIAHAVMRNLDVKVDAAESIWLFGEYCAQPSNFFGSCVPQLQRGTFTPQATITGGPVGATKDATPSFTFAGGGEDTSYRCTLTGAWEACESGKSYPELADGEYTFQVGLTPAGEPDAAEPDPDTVTEQKFTVDTTAPKTAITGGPVGETVSPSPELTWTSDDPQALYTCQLTGQAPEPCASPKRYSGLAFGDYTFTVRASDALDNTDETGVSRSFSVVNGDEPDPEPEPEPEPTVVPTPDPGAGGGGGGVPPLEDDGEGESCSIDDAPDASALGARRVMAAAAPKCQPPGVDCPAGAQDKVTTGALTVVATSAKACFRPTDKNRQTAWTSPGPVKANGVTLSGAGAYVVDKADKTFAGPASTATLGVLSFPVGRFDFPVNNNELAGGFLKPVGGKIKGYEVEASPSITFSGDEDGKTTVVFELALPDYFSVKQGKTGAAKADGVSGSVTFSASNEKGVNLAGNLTVPRAYMFKWFQAKNISVGFDWQTGSATGGATLIVPRGPVYNRKEFDAELRVDLTFKSGVLAGASVAAQKVDKPLGYGVFLQRVGGSFNLAANPWYLTAHGGVSFGPYIDLGDLWQGELASLDADLKLSLENKGPVLEANGTGKLVNQTLTKAGLKWDMAAKKTTFNWDAQAAIGQWGLFWQVKDAEWSGASSFHAEGFGKLNIPGQITKNVEALAGSKGMVICWGAKGKPRAGKVVVFGFDRVVDDPACDLGKWRATVAPRGLMAAQATPGTRTTTLPKGLPIAQFAAVGVEAPPKITLTSPTGEKIITPADGSGIDTDSVLLYQDPDNKQTVVVLQAPAAGRWTVEIQEGSPAVREVKVADGLPEVKVTGRVFRGKLRYTLKPIPGQRVTFTDEGAPTSRTLGTVSRASGTLRVPVTPGGGRRRIVATVTQDGNVRDVIAVASFQAPKLKPLAAPGKLRVIRSGSSVKLTWRRVPSAASYQVIARMSDGRKRLLPTRGTSLKLGGVAKTETGAFEVLAVSADGRQGKPTRGALAKAKPPKKRRH